MALRKGLGEVSGGTGLVAELRMEVSMLVRGERNTVVGSDMTVICCSAVLATSSYFSELNETV